IAEVERRASLLALPRCSNVIEDNGKEKDPETGFLYYGARYHWPEVWTGWLSPDPMMDVYPGISPYNYCNWNPVIFVDPDGREAGDPLKVMKIRRMRLSNTFGMVRHRADGTLKPHQGIDYYAPQGTPVYAVKDGTIVDIGTQGDYGKTITLEFKQDDGTMAYAFYAHLSAQNVKVGQTVYEGDEIGLTGNTGNASNMKGEDEHLHFEYRTGGSNLGLGLKGRDNPNLIVDTKFEIDPNNSNKVVQVRPILEPKHKCILK
ncbi:MAG: secreted protein, partial [bacterium P3]